MRRGSSPAFNLLLLLSLAVGPACPGPGTTRCGEATCPRGYSCDPKHTLCVLPSQLADCVGLPDGTACTVRGAGGYLCDQEVCIPATCGDGYVTGAEQCDGESLGGATCASLGLRGGALGCTGECRFDTTGCLGAGPVITGIEGTGPATEVAPRPEDQGAYEAVPEADRRPASQRVSGSEREMVVSGVSLGGATAAQAEGQAGQGTITFEIQPGGTETMVRLRFPTTMTVTAGGLFLLTLTTVAGEAEAQVFFLQGEAGQCSNTITGDLTVNGNVTITGTATITDADVQALTVTRTYVLPPCPEGYEEDMAVFGGLYPEVHVCVHPTSGDEMVRVGDFWIDRYEASLWSQPGCTGTQYGAGTTDNYPAGFPDTGNVTAPVYSCSIPGVTPSRMMTWFQAEQACGAMGKRLCTNAEWQAAVSGTFDPGDAEASGTSQCRIASTNTGPRTTSQTGATPGSTLHCISRHGSEDMIGNLLEWTADWYGHPGWNGVENPMSAAYGGDSYYAGGPTAANMPTRETNESWRPYSPGIEGYGDTAGEFFGPSAGLRGGRWYDGSRAGAFAMYLVYGPSAWRADGGARCCRVR